MEKEIKRLKTWIVLFITALFISGFTAIPVETELAFLSRCFSPGTFPGEWIDKVYTGVKATNDTFPFIAYGYDWLAFAHFVLAVLFIGPLKDPVRNKWVIEFGIIACLMIIPFAFIAGHFRGIPVGWRLIDCSFGVVGLVPLCICRAGIRRLERSGKKDTSLHPFAETSIVNQ